MYPYVNPPAEKSEKKDPVYIATGSFSYRFEDGTYLRMTEGVAIPEVGPGHLKELRKYKHIKEVK